MFKLNSVQWSAHSLRPLSTETNFSFVATQSDKRLFVSSLCCANRSVLLRKKTTAETSGVHQQLHGHVAVMGAQRYVQDVCRRKTAYAFEAWLVCRAALPCSSQRLWSVSFRDEKLIQSAAFCSESYLSLCENEWWLNALNVCVVLSSQRLQTGPSRSFSVYILHLRESVFQGTFLKLSIEFIVLAQGLKQWPCNCFVSSLKSLEGHI